MRLKRQPSLPASVKPDRSWLLMPMLSPTLMPMLSLTLMPMLTLVLMLPGRRNGLVRSPQSG